MKRINFFKQQAVLNFKKWVGRAYAVFNTLHREVRIGALVTAYLTVMGFHNTFAQVDTSYISKKIKLNEVEVSARRSPALYSEVGRVVTVLSRARIEAMPVQSVQELLRYAMGVDVRERGPLGIQADLSMRGGSFDQVMVLLNGVNITDPQTGHHTLNLPVDLQSIDRIEILSGPGARVYGPNAFNGAINIITGTAPKNQAVVRTMAGDHGLYSLGLDATIKSESVTNYFAVQKGASQGYMSNTDFDLFNIFYHGQLRLNNEKLSLQLGQTNKSFGANSFYSARYPNQFEATRTKFAGLSFETGERIKLRSNLYWRRHHDRFELFRSYTGAADWYTGHNYHLTDVLGAGLNAVIPSRFGKTSLGGEMRGERVLSNNLGLDMDKPLAVSGEDGAFFTKSFTRNNASFFLEHNYTFNRFSVSAGVMMNQNSQLGSRVDFFPGMDVSYWFSPRLKWMASYNKSLRLPTFTDLFYSGPTNQGNPNLKPEEAQTLETGIRFTDGWYNTHLSLFMRDGRDLIDWGKTAEETRYTTSNINSVKAYGIELSGTFDLQQAIVGQTVFRELNINYAYIHQDKKPEAGYESYYVLDHLRHKLNIGVDHSLGIRNLWASWNFLYRDRVGYYTVSATNSLQNYSDFWLTDLRLSYKKQRFVVYAEATNLFDHRYADLGELIQPGRWFKAGVQVEFGF